MSVVVSCTIEKQTTSTMIERLAAAKLLTGTAFKLYNYLDSLPLGKSTYKRTEATENIGMERAAINNGFKELREKNFLIPEDEFHYKFFCSPEEKNE